MNPDEYSTYDAKAQFSALLRKVREGGTVTITYRGEPVAELRPIQVKEGIDARVDRLRSKGRITGGGSIKGKLAVLADRPGALHRFIEERDGP